VVSSFRRNRLNVKLPSTHAIHPRPRRLLYHTEAKTEESRVEGHRSNKISREVEGCQRRRLLVSSQCQLERRWENLSYPES
jgi:hypothetical protein